MDTSKAFVIEPAVNGGVVVRLPSDVSRGPLVMPEFAGAFTTPADMIAWLAEQYGVSVDVIPVVRVKEVSRETAADEWVTWSGFSTLDDYKGLPCMIRMRDGKERAGKTFDDTKRWYWSRNNEQLKNDVVAYRLIANDWIDWSGGDRPVGVNVPVEVKFRDGRINSEMQAGYWSWLDRGSSLDIIAYRVVTDE